MVLVASNSYAAVKAGSACSKVGSKSVSGGKSYTCVKSGKKLVWNKGVTVSNTTTTQRDEFAIYGKDAARFKSVDEYGAKLVSSRVKSSPAINSILQSPTDKAVIRMTENAQYAFSVYEQLMPLGFTPKLGIGSKTNSKMLHRVCPFSVPIKGEQVVAWSLSGEASRSKMMPTPAISCWYKVDMSSFISTNKNSGKRTMQNFLIG